jgi:hypothetical protein
METVKNIKRMKTIKKIIVVLPLLALLFACQKEKVQPFDTSMNGVYFEFLNNATDTVRFSFATLPNPMVESAIFTLPAHLAGAIADYDRIFFVETLNGPKNPDTRYEIIQPSVLKAGETIADIEIRVWKTPNLAIARDTITVVLKGSSDLVAEFARHSTRSITFFSGIDRPSWWTASVENNHMGRYHEIKMEILQIVLGSMDNPTSPLVTWTFFNQPELNWYCAVNDIRYPDTGEPVRFLPGF